MDSRRLLASTLFTVLLAATPACSSSDTPGAGTYANNCARCHGAQGNGGIGASLKAGSEAALLTDEQIIEVIRTGPERMPSFTSFTDQELADLVTFVRSLQND